MKKLVLLFILLVKVISGYSQNDSIVAEMVGDYDVKVMTYCTNRNYEPFEDEDCTIAIRQGNDTVDFFIQYIFIPNKNFIWYIPCKFTETTNSTAYFMVQPVKIGNEDVYNIFKKNERKKYKQVQVIPFFDRTNKKITVSIDYDKYRKDTPLGESLEQGTYLITGAKK